MEIYGYEIAEGGKVVHLLSPLPPPIVFMHGLVSEAILGIARELNRDTGNVSVGRVARDRIRGGRLVVRHAITRSDIVPHDELVRSLHKSWARHGPSLAGLMRAAASRREGFVHIVDMRTPTPGGDVPAEDLVGGFSVRNGRLGEFTANERYEVLGPNGLALLDPSFEALFLRDLEALVVRANSAEIAAPSTTRAARPVRHDPASDATLAEAKALEQELRFDEAEAAYQRAYEMARQSGAVASIGAACFGLARLCFTGDRLEDASGWCKRELRAYGSSLASLEQASVELACEIAFRHERAGASEEAAACWELLIGWSSDKPIKSAELTRVLAEASFAARTAAAIYNGGVQLLEAKRPEDAVRTFAGLRERFGESDDPGVLESVFAAYLNEGLALASLGQLHAALELQDRLIERTSTFVDVRSRHAHAAALRAKAVLLHDHGQIQASLAATQTLLLRFATAAEPTIRQELVIARSVQGKALAQLERWHEAEQALLDVLRMAREMGGVSIELAVDALIQLGQVLFQLARNEDAIAAFDEALGDCLQLTGTLAQAQTARALIGKGHAYGALTLPYDALKSYDEVLARFGEAKVPVVRTLVFRARNYRGLALMTLGQHEEAIAAFVELRALGAGDRALHEQLAASLNNEAVALVHLKREDEARARLDELITRFADVPEQFALARQHRGALQTDVIDPAVQTLYAEAVRYEGAGDAEAAAKFFAEVIARLDGSTSPLEQTVLAIAMGKRAFTWTVRGDYEAAVAGFDRVLTRFHDASELEIRGELARCLVSKGAALQNMNRVRDAVAAFDAAIDFGGAGESYFDATTAAALINKGLAYEQMGQPEPALAAYGVLAGRFLHDEREDVRHRVATALARSCELLGRLNRTDEALRTCDRLIDTFERSSSAEIQLHVAGGMMEKANLKSLNGSAHEALALFDQVFRRFSATPVPALRRQAALALFAASGTLHQLHREDEALHVYDLAIRTFESDSDAVVQSVVADAFCSKGMVLHQAGNFAAALPVLDEMLARFSARPEPQIRERVGACMLERGDLLTEVGRIEDALRAYDVAMQTFGTASPQDAGITAFALCRKGYVFGRFGRYPEAARVFQEVLTRFERERERGAMFARAIESAEHGLLNARARLAERR